MSKLTFEKDCGNSPKAQVIKELNLAFLNKDIPKFLAFVSAEISWDFVGQYKINGIRELEAFMHDPQETIPTIVNLKNIITHGNKAAASGWMQMEDKTEFEFCDIYTFAGFGKNALIKEIKSFVLPLTN